MTQPTSLLCEEEHILLHNIAKEAIAYGLQHGERMPVDTQRYPKLLREPRASFVTLTISGNLRGCIGSLEAYQALVSDVAHNAYAAAFSDPRFPPLTSSELPVLDIHISVLSKPEAMLFSSEQDLLSQIRPGIDGLILEDGLRRGTFLPSVWEQLPGAVEFLRHLKQKAGLPPDYWSETIKVSRYTTESF